MLRSKYIDRICCLLMVVMLLFTTALWGVAGTAEGDRSHISAGYETSLFDSSTVHTIDIQISDWEGLIEKAQSEEYVKCNVIIDGEKFNNVAVRAKGNTSLSSVASLGSSRYSFKIEFDHFVDGLSYHGLDKLSLNNLIQDATMMKDYLAYTLMNRMDVPSPLCSYVQIHVNGQPWGLYLAVEGVEDGFLERNGMTGGALYKPDSMSFGGGRGNGKDFDMEKFRSEDSQKEETSSQDAAAPAEGEFAGSSGMPGGDFGPSGGQSAPDHSGVPDSGTSSGMPGGDFTPPTGGEGAEMPSPPGSGEVPSMPEGGFSGFNFGMGNDDVKLIYSDDNPDSYPNIFDNAKTNVTKKDKQRLIEALRKLNGQEDLENTVDTDEVIRYLAVHNYLCNDDSYSGMMVHNYYLYEKDGQLSIIPWDYNLAFGGFSASVNATSTVNTTIDSPVSGGTVESRPLISWIFSDEASLEQYHQIYDGFLTETIENGWLESEIARVQEMISPYLERDESKFYEMEEFEKAVDTLQTFCAKRGQSVRGQLNGTIASTTGGRQRNSSSLIDASDISTADMGSMNSDKGGGFGGGGIPGRDANSTPASPRPNSSAPVTPPDQEFQGSGGMPNGAMPENMPDNTEPAVQTEGGPPAAGGFTPPDGSPGGHAQEGSSSRQWMSAALCAAILLAGLLAVKRASSHN